MTKTELKEAIRRMIEAAEITLSTMPDDRPVPGDGELILTDLGQVRISTGVLTDNGSLQVYLDGISQGPTTNCYEWKPLPNVLQFTPHDGSSECPVDADKPVLVAEEDFVGKLFNKARRASWVNVTFYADLSKLILE